MHTQVNAKVTAIELMGNLYTVGFLTRKGLSAALYIRHHEITKVVKTKE